MILILSSFLSSYFHKLCLAEYFLVLECLNMYAFCTLPCHIICEMLSFYPMNLKICMMKLDTLLDILVLSLHFSHYWLLRYVHVNVGLTMCVTPLLAQLDEFFAMPIKCQMI